MTRDRKIKKLKIKHYQQALLCALLFLICFSFFSSPVKALAIQFDYSLDGGFFDDQDRRNRLQQAANFYTSFTDSLSSINSSSADPSNADQWSVQFNNPSDLASQVQRHNLSVSADTLTVYVGGSAMGSSVLGFGTTGTLFNVSGSSDFTDSVFTRGQDNATGVSATDYGTWGGAISFNSDVNWFWGEASAGLDNSSNDFLTTAAHELGHLLGYGSADSWFSQIDSGLFSGDASIASYGGLVPIGPGHWAEGVMSTYNGIDQETMMDPTTPSGIRQLPTDLDYAGLKDIGWEVQKVPLPAAAWLMISGLGALFGMAATKKYSI